MKQMKTLTIGSTTYEVVDEAARGRTYADVGAAPAGYGLGEEVKFVSSIDDLLVPGQYKFYNGGNSLIADAPNMRSCDVEVVSSGTGCIQRITSTIDACRAERMYDGTIFWPFEWVNPPMVPGVEYRTTKRHNGKAVYAKLLNLGNLPNTGTAAFSVAEGVDRFIHTQTTLKNGSGSRDVVNSDVVTLKFGHNRPGEINNGSWVDVITTTDMSDYVAELTVEYTKV